MGRSFQEIVSSPATTFLSASGGGEDAKAPETWERLLTRETGVFQWQASDGQSVRDISILSEKGVGEYFKRRMAATSTTSSLLALSAILIACCATAVDKCNEGQVNFLIYELSTASQFSHHCHNFHNGHKCNEAR